MQKTRIGISVGLMGAAVYFMGLCGGAIALLLIAGYVLLFEENQWLRKCAVKSVALYLTVAVVNYVIYLIPDAIAFIGTFVGIFGGYFYSSFISSLAELLSGALTLARTVFFILLGLKALTQGDIRIPVLDSLIEKYTA